MTSRRRNGAGAKRSTALNKKILCFIDESGTAGAGAISFGAVFVFARDAARVDKRFSDQLEANANEIHAAKLSDNYLQGLLHRFWADGLEGQIVMVNQLCPARDGDAATLYAEGVVATVKAGLRLFKSEVLGRETIGNVELIIDANNHNCDATFMAAIKKAQAEDGRFRAVNHVACLDSAASRLLQLADVAASTRRWVTNADLNAEGLRRQYGVRLP